MSPWLAASQCEMEPSPCSMGSLVLVVVTHQGGAEHLSTSLSFLLLRLSNLTLLCLFLLSFSLLDLFKGVH